MAGKKGSAGRKPITCCKKQRQLYIMIEGCDIEALGCETKTKMAMKNGVEIAKKIKQNPSLESELKRILG